jgi:hypothetical protein
MWFNARRLIAAAGPFAGLGQSLPVSLKFLMIISSFQQHTYIASIMTLALP